MAIVALLAIAIVAGCSGKNEGASPSASAPASPSAEASPSGSAAPEAKTNEFGWEAPAETTKFQYYEASRRNPDEVARNTKAMRQYLNEKFNVDVDKIVFDIDPKERLNMMLVSGDYPEVIAGLESDAMSKWSSQGKLIDLVPLIDKYGPNIKKALGDKYSLYLDKDGKMFGLPRNWGYLPIPDFAAHIRLDWYEAMGSPKIETPEDYYNVLKQMVADHPTNAKGEKVYAISWHEQINIESILGFWGLKEGYKEDENKNLTHWLNTPEGIEIVKYYNRFYREGLFDPDAFINKYDDWKAKFSNERVAGHLGLWWNTWNAGHEVWMKTLPDYKENMRYIQIGMKPKGVEKTYLAPKDTFGSSFLSLTDKAQNPEALIKFIDFTMTPIGSRLMGWGVPNTEGSLWHFEGDGKWKFDEPQKQALLAGTFDWAKSDLLGGYALAYNIGYMPDDNKSTWYYDQNFVQEEKWKKLIHDNLGDTVYDNTARRVTFAVDNPLTLVNQQITELIKNGFAKAVTSKTEADMLANFNEMKDKANSLGLKDLEKFRTEEYKKWLEILK